MGSFRDLVLRLHSNGTLSVSLSDEAGVVVATRDVALPLPSEGGGEKALSDAVLGSPVGEVLAAAIPARTRIVVEGNSGALHARRWERLVLPGAPAPLAVGPHTPLSRLLFPDSSERAHAPATEWPLRVAVAISAPADVEGWKLAPIDADLEWSEITRAFKPLRGLVDLERIESPVSLDRVAQALEGRPHVLHWLGHGAFSASSGGSVLYFEDEDDRKVRPVDEASLVARLEASGSLPHLVVLAACESAAQTRAGALVGLAPALIEAGCGAVVAMNDKIGIDAARDFCHHLYRRMATHGLVDLSVNEARSYLLQGGGWGWSFPTAFVERGAEQIFASPPDALEAEPAAPGETVVLVTEFKGHEEAHFEFELRERLQAEIEKAELGEVRVVWLEHTTLGPSADDDARRLAARYGAALVIWGWFDRAALRVCFTVTDSLFAYHDPAAALADTSVRHELDATQDFAFLVNRALPRQVDYFAFFLLGQLRYWGNDMRGALAALTKAIDVGAGEGSEVDGLQHAYFYRGNIHAVHVQDRFAAIADYERALELAPGLTAAAFNLAQARRTLGNRLSADGDERGAAEAYRAAVADYGKALETDAEYVLALEGRGIAHFDLDEPENAVRDFIAATDLSPRAVTYDLLGVGLARLERWPDALVAFDAAVARAPAAPQHRYNRAKARLEVGDEQGAVEDLEEFTRLAPASAPQLPTVKDWLARRH